MQTLVHRGGPLSPDLFDTLTEYRHDIFVGKLGWELPGSDGRHERDKYDRNDTVYVMTRNQRGATSGCARLLPTTSPYLLEELFPHLMTGAEMPHAPDVWELSRFAASFGTESGWAVQPLLAAVVECATKLGAHRIIGVTYLSMERLFRRIGVHVHRAGPPVRVDDRMVIACWVELDEQTRAALGVTADGCGPFRKSVPEMSSNELA